MKLKFLLLLIAEVALAQALFAQSKVKTLIKNDIVPAEMSIGKLMNYKSKTAKFSDFRGKLVILDFWNTHCSPCVKELPGMDSLQKEFGNEIAIIPVTRNKLPEVQSYFKKKKIDLPSVIEDSILSKVFPQLSAGMHVWINGKGKVIMTTDGDEVNSKTISEYLKTGKLNVKERIDWNVSAPIVEQNNTKADEFLGYSLLRKCKTPGNFTYDYNKSISVRGMDFLWLYNLVLSMNRREYKAGEYGIILGNPNWFIVEIDGKIILPTHYYEERENPRDSLINWLAGIAYDYDFKIPYQGAKSDSVFFRKYMLEDLNRVSPYKGRVEKRKVKSWIIVKKDDFSSFISKSSTSSNEQIKIVYHDNLTKDRLEKVDNITFGKFIQLCMYSQHVMMPPVFNETGYDTEKISLKNLNLDYCANKGKAFYGRVNIDEWRAAFNRNGLDIKVEDRDVEVMILTKETPAK